MNKKDVCAKNLGKKVWYPIQEEVMVDCDACEGSGALYDREGNTLPSSCKGCQGSGRIRGASSIWTVSDEPDELTGFVLGNEGIEINIDYDAWDPLLLKDVFFNKKDALAECARRNKRPK